MTDLVSELAYDGWDVVDFGQISEVKDYMSESIIDVHLISQFSNHITSLLHGSGPSELSTTTEIHLY